MTIRAVFFDLDGTLVDSLPDLTDAANHMRETFSRPPLTLAEVRLKVGKGARNLVQQALPGATEDDIDRALSLFLDFNREHIADKSRLYPGIPELLHELAARDIKMAVITNKNEDLSALILQVLGLSPLVAAIAGGDTFPERKPSPLPLLKIAALLGVAPAECLMVGDSINDFAAARQAGIASIGCAWGYGSAEELGEADIPAGTPDELLAAITAVSGNVP